MNTKEMIKQIDKLVCQKIITHENLEELIKQYGELLKMAVEDIKVAAESEYLCDVCAHFVNCDTCEYRESLCDIVDYDTGKCPSLVLTPCNGCDYNKGTNFLWRGYVKN